MGPKPVRSEKVALFGHLGDLGANELADLLGDPLAQLPAQFLAHDLRHELPQLLFVLFAPVIGSVRTAIAGSMELTAMLAVAVLAYAEALTMMQGLAAVLIIGAVALGALARADASG